MRKRILLATSALALTAGSIFAFAGAGAEQTITKTATEQCPSECCNGNGGNCGPDECKTGAADCCEE